ncbi:NAD(P)/FAD-dependent oxidoreductase [soil metagenome]
MNSKKHIAIVGAGLVGSLLAIYLKKRGYAVSVFERRPDMRKSGEYAGRSINLALSNRGLRALEEVELAEKIKPVTIPLHGRTMHDLKGNLSFLPYGTAGQFINSVSRSGLNIVLMDEAERLGVKINFGQRTNHVDLDKTELTLSSGTQTFDLIIGADGAFSAVRGAFQITDRFDYDQRYIQHGYKELTIPAGKGGAFQLEKNSLHIWPRESFMLIALPNPDGSFTCTLFFPFEGDPSFESLKTEKEIQQFFQQVFPDAAELIPGLLEEFHKNPSASLVTIKCFPWVRNKTLLLGDAAHAIVPFYGQGMNAGFEDCRVLNDLLNKRKDNWDDVLPEFEELRKPDADAIAQLALDNFVEMRDLVGDVDFLLRKKIEAKLHQLFPDKWIPLYSMVTFHEDIRYSEALAIGRKQREIMDEVMSTPTIESTWTSLDFAQIANQLKN